MGCSKGPMRGERGQFSFVGLLVAVLIIGLMTSYILKTYVAKPNVDKGTAATLEQQGIRTENYHALTDSVKQKLSDFSQRQQAEFDAVSGQGR
jgi:Tfp pilus assembly protein PilE